MEEKVIEGYVAQLLTADAVHHINRFILVIPVLLVILGGFLATL